MRKNVLGKKFSRDTTSRRAMYRALVRSLVLNRRLVTTYTKAKVIVPMVENLLNKGKRDGITAHRSIYVFTGNDRVVTDEIVRISKNLKNSGRSMLKHINLPARKGDNAPMVRVEFIDKITLGEVSSDTKTGNEVKKGGKVQKVWKKTEKTGKKISTGSIVKKLSLTKKKREK